MFGWLVSRLRNPGGYGPDRGLEDETPATRRLQLGRMTTPSSRPPRGSGSPASGAVASRRGGILSDPRAARGDGGRCRGTPAAVVLGAGRGTGLGQVTTRSPVPFVAAL